MNNLKNFDSYSDNEFKTGDRIELVNTTDSYTNLKPGDRGVVRGVDDLGNILIQWDNGSSLSMIPGVDEIKKIL